MEWKKAPRRPDGGPLPHGERRRRAGVVRGGGGALLPRAAGRRLGGRVV